MKKEIREQREEIAALKDHIQRLQDQCDPCAHVALFRLEEHAHLRLSPTDQPLELDEPEVRLVMMMVVVVAMAVVVVMAMAAVVVMAVVVVVVVVVKAETAGHRSRTPLTEAVPVFRDCVGDTEGGSGWNGGAKRAEARLATPIASWCRRKPRRANAARKQPPTSPPCWWAQQRNVGSSDEEEARAAEAERGCSHAVGDRAACVFFQCRARCVTASPRSTGNHTPTALASGSQHDAGIATQLAAGRGVA